MKYIFTHLMPVMMLLTATSAATTDMHVVLKYRSSVFNKKYVEKILTPRRPLNRTTSITSTDIQLKPNVVLDAPLYIQLAMFRKFATQYKPFMVDYTFEVCEALILKTHPLYMVFHHKTNESESNFLNPCPKKGHLFIKPYYTSYEHLPPLFPSGIWRMDITLSKSPDDKIFTLSNYYEVTTHGIIEF